MIVKKLVRASAWIKEVFPEGGVGTAKVKRWVLDRVIVGAIIDGEAFVDADRTALLLENSVELTPAAVDARATVGNAVVAHIVQAGLQLAPAAR